MHVQHANCIWANAIKTSPGLMIIPGNDKASTSNGLGLPICRHSESLGVVSGSHSVYLLLGLESVSADLCMPLSVSAAEIYRVTLAVKFARAIEGIFCGFQKQHELEMFSEGDMNPLVWNSALKS